MPIPRIVAGAACFALLSVASCARAPEAGRTFEAAPPMSVSGDLGSDAAAMPPGISDVRNGCFAGQMPAVPWAGRAAAATLHMRTMNGHNDMNGSGFVIRDSSPPGHPGNRMLTAGHFADDIIENGNSVDVATPDGHILGSARVVARGSGYPVLVDNTYGMRGDTAVLEMFRFTPGAEEVYGKIEGLDLSPHAARKMLVGLITTPAGIAGGASGGPVLDSSGRVVASVAAAFTDGKNTVGDALWNARVKLDAGDSTWSMAWIAPAGSRRTALLPAASKAYFEPISDAAVLAQLGAAGRSRTIQDTAPPTKVTILGYPAEACVVYSGTIRPVSSEEPDVRLTRR